MILPKTQTMISSMSPLSLANFLSIMSSSSSTIFISTFNLDESSFSASHSTFSHSKKPQLQFSFQSGHLQNNLPGFFYELDLYRITCLPQPQLLSCKGVQELDERALIRVFWVESRIWVLFLAIAHFWIWF
uniref:Uncharacterized protein n=1 Tax=Lotus japonicus TaxID=34305 RepID=I3TA35_LOTJA|nr:unknown [Lotus japonicus]